MCGGGACVGQGGVHGGRHAQQGGHGGMWQGRHAWQGGHVWWGWGACVAEETVTAEDGRHPTGMHSCLFVFFSLTKTSL